MAMICDECRHIGHPQRLLVDDDWYWHHQDIAKFQESAHKGCFVCRTILQEVEHVESDSMMGWSPGKDYVLKYHFSDGREAGGRHIGLSFFPAWMDPGSFQRGPPFPVRVSIMKATEKELDESSSDIGPTTGSEQAQSLATSWLSDCHRNHDLCRFGNGLSAWWPTRLIDVSGGVAGNPVLVLTDKNPITERYLTLSHSWGKAKILRLLSTNIKALQEEIPLQTLSKTFQHAIQITKSLGERYLWIDSLCILQDSQEDWSKEAQTMHQVYLHGYCNISATSANDGTEGCFYPRSRNTIGPAIFTPCWEEESAFWRIWHIRFREREVVEARLGKRAWVVQERLLSARKLLYTSSQLHWQCREMTACEAFPRGISKYCELNPSNRLIKMLQDLDSHGSDTSRREDLLRDALYDWREIVREYSGAALTFPSDKPVAIAGIANLLTKSSRDDYVSGLWYRNFVDQLAWWIDDGNQVDGIPSYRPTPRRAPTWSWISVEGVVYTGQTGSDTRSVRLINGPELVRDIPVNGSTGQSPKNLLSTAVTIETITCRAMVLRRSRHLPHANVFDLLLMEHGFDLSSLKENPTDKKLEPGSFTAFVDGEGNLAYANTYCFNPDEGVIQHYEKELLCAIWYGEEEDCSDVSSVDDRQSGTRYYIQHAILLLPIRLPDVDQECHERVGQYTRQVAFGTTEEYFLKVQKKTITIV